MEIDRQAQLCYIKQMNIEWSGHSCFKIQGNKSTVVTDPYSPSLGYSLGQLQADLVTVSHQHPGHSYVQAIGGKPRLITSSGEYEVSDVFILGIGTYHDETKGKDKGKNTVFAIEMDGITICHLGDLGHALTSEQAEAIGDVHVLMLPVGGVRTINASVAAQTVRQLEPKIVIPMHYKTAAPIDCDLEPVEKFFKEIGVKDIVPQPKLTINKAGLPLVMQVVLLEQAK